MTKSVALGGAIILLMVIILLASISGSILVDDDIPIHETTPKVIPEVANAKLDSVVSEAAESPPEPLPAKYVPLPEPRQELPDAELTPELEESILAFKIEYYSGRYDHAALIALDAIETSGEYPKLVPNLHANIGMCYEKLGYYDMAIEQYRMAIELSPDPNHPVAHNALRRLDTEFAATNPERPKAQPKKKSGDSVASPFAFRFRIPAGLPKVD